MRITVDLSDGLFRELRQKAPRDGVTLEELVIHALESEAFKTPSLSKKRISSPLILCRSESPISLTNAEIEDLLD